MPHSKTNDIKSPHLQLTGPGLWRTYVSREFGGLVSLNVCQEEQRRGK